MERPRMSSQGVWAEFRRQPPTAEASESFPSVNMYSLERTNGNQEE